jgi:hypothetical protein
MHSHPEAGLPRSARMICFPATSPCLHSNRGAKLAGYVFVRVCVRTSVFFLHYDISMPSPKSGGKTSRICIFVCMCVRARACFVVQRHCRAFTQIDWQNVLRTLVSVCPCVRVSVWDREIYMPSPESAVVSTPP